MSATRKKQYYDEAGRLIIKPYRLRDLSQIFDVSESTLKRWFSTHQEALDKQGRQYFTVQQVQYMIAQFGLPQKLEIHIPVRLNNAA